MSVDSTFSHTNSHTPLLELINILALYQGMKFHFGHRAQTQADLQRPPALVGSMPNGRTATFDACHKHLEDLTDEQLGAMRMLVDEHNSRVPLFKANGWEYTITRFKAHGKYYDSSCITLTAGPTMYEAFAAVHDALDKMRYVQPYFTTVVEPKGHPHGYPFCVSATEFH